MSFLAARPHPGPLPEGEGALCGRPFKFAGAPAILVSEVAAHSFLPPSVSPLVERSHASNESSPPTACDWLPAGQHPHAQYGLRPAGSCSLGDEPGILTPPQPAKAAYEVRSPAISAQISADGALVGLTLGGGKIERIVAGNTELGGCRVQGEVAARKLDGGVEFAKQLVHKASKNRCVMVERFLPTNDSIRWEIEIRGEGGPWTTSIETRLNYTAGAESRFWTTWGDPDDRRDWWQEPAGVAAFGRSDMALPVRHLDGMDHHGMLLHLHPAGHRG